MNVKSNVALCATNTHPRANSTNDGNTHSTGGAPATARSSIPVRWVIWRGTGTCGFTSASNVPVRSPPRSLTAPTSVMRLSTGEPPVVSRSTTTNSTSDSATPSSSEAWIGSASTRTPSLRGRARKEELTRTGVRGSRGQGCPAPCLCAQQFVLDQERDQLPDRDMGLLDVRGLRTRDVDLDIGKGSKRATGCAGERDRAEPCGSSPLERLDHVGRVSAGRDPE